MPTYERLEDLDDSALTARYAPPDGVESWLRVNFVSSLDGAVTVDGRSAGLSGAADMRVFKILRMRCDALVVGAGTVRREAVHYRALRLTPDRTAWRREAGMPDHPTMAVVSRSADLNPEAPMFIHAPVRPIVITCQAAPAGAREALSETAEVIVAGDDGVDFSEAVRQLRKRGLRQILCEGGPHVLGEITSADLVDEVCLTVSPLLAGAGAGRITAGPGSPVRRMRLSHVLEADDYLMLRYVRHDR
ncbi:MAG: pyrimidine reductase family protein [Stackebrandtia sp.]